MENEGDDRTEVDLNLTPESAPHLSDTTITDDQLIEQYLHQLRPRFRWRRRLGRLLFPPATPPPPAEIPRISMGFISTPELQVPLAAGESNSGAGERTALAAGTDLIARALGENNADEENSQGENVSYFECNICLETATDPVLTSCGHLFCWPCLYQSLHIRPDSQECPVCKGEVTDKNLIPIYGRGSEEEKTEKADRELGFNVPPRPQAQRIESERQRSWLAPIPLGMEDVTRRISLSSALLGASMDTLERINASVDQIRNRLRVVQGLRRDDANQRTPTLGRSGLFRSESNARHGLHGRGRDARMRILSLLRLQRPDREAAAGSDVLSAASPVEPLIQISHDDRLGPGVTERAEQIPEHVFVDGGASVSSTPDFIDLGSPVRDSATEPDSVAISPSVRSGRNIASRSLDVDASVSRPPKRRRLN